VIDDAQVNIRVKHDIIFQRGLPTNTIGRRNTKYSTLHRHAIHLISPIGGACLRDKLGVPKAGAAMVRTDLESILSNELEELCLILPSVDYF